MLFVSIDLRPRMSCGNDMHIALSSLLDLVFYVFMCALYTCIWCRDSSLISLSNLTAISCQRFYNIRFDVDSCIEIGYSYIETRKTGIDLCLLVDYEALLVKLALLLAKFSHVALGNN